MSGMFMRLWVFLAALVQAASFAPLRRAHDDEEGFSTAELLGNAALGIAALVVIWFALRQLGFDIVEWIRAQLMGGDAGSP